MTKPVNIVRFQGRLAGKNIDHFMSQLDYYDNKTQQERIDEINKILYTQPGRYSEELFLDSFFEQYFDDWFKVNPNATYPLSDDHEICRKLSRMASYILYAHDAERITKKTVYNFYTEREFWKKLNKEKSTDEIAENKGNDEIGVDVVIDFLSRKTQNYKKQVKQKILAKDLSKVHFIGTNGKKYYPLKDYQKTIDRIKYKTKFDFKNKENNKKLINSLYDDQILCKDKLNGTIYFKDVLPESTEIHWDMFDFFDKNHVMALLKVPPRDSMTELGSLISALEGLLEQCDLYPTDSEILALYRRDLMIGDIAKRLEVESHIISGALTRICNKVMDAYEDQYEDWYYLNIVKGKFKKCSVCGEIIIANERHFRKDAKSKDGFKSKCKKCDKNKAESTELT